MAEEVDGPEAGEFVTGVDPFAAAVALGGASRAEADAFLKKQRLLADIQIHHLQEQFKSLRLTIWEKRTGVLLRAATAIVGIVAAGFVGLMLWDAANSNGLIIEPFAVPADMAAKGLTGQVVASQMLDKLAVMQSATDSGRPPQSYANDWGNNIRVEIPETGISISELQQFLKGWLGHDTHITGEVWRTPTGIAVTARDSSEAGVTFTGAESDLDGLLQKAAEHVYGITQPYRYANYLDRDYAAPDIADRAARASTIYRKLIAGPSASERAWAWNGLGTIENRVKHDPAMAYVYYRKSVAAEPDFTLGYFALGSFEMGFGRYENSLAAALKTKALLDRGNRSGVSADQLPLRRLNNDGDIANDKGDYGEAFRAFKGAADMPQEVASLSRASLLPYAFGALANQHNGVGLRGYMREVGVKSLSGLAALSVAEDQEDWPAILETEKTIPESARQQAYRGSPRTRAAIALAHAHTGDLAGAQALIAPSPTDCDDCSIVRGQLADMQGQHSRADGWFAQVEKAEPTVPFADAAWGRALVTRGDAAGAIAKFTLANRKGPHFADPLEGWGEALMKQSHSDRALAKFAEADKYAPNWGRLHLKWGEALGYAGKKDDAQKQYALAAALDLSAADKAELARRMQGKI